MDKRSTGWIVALGCLAALLTFALPQSTQAQDLPGGFGIGLGSGTGAGGVSLKTPLGGNSSLQGVVGTWYGWTGDWREPGDTLAVSADYLLEMPTIASAEPFDIGWNYGLGGGVGIGDLGGIGLGGAGVLGLNIDFSPAALPLDVALEWRPGLYLTNDDNFDVEPVHFTGHVRLWF